MLGYGLDFVFWDKICNVWGKNYVYFFLRVGVMVYCVGLSSLS